MQWKAKLCHTKFLIKSEEVMITVEEWEMSTHYQKATELETKHFHNKMTADNTTESRWWHFKTFYIFVDVFTTQMKG